MTLINLIFADYLVTCVAMALAGMIWDQDVVGSVDGLLMALKAKFVNRRIFYKKSMDTLLL